MSNENFCASDDSQPYNNLQIIFNNNNFNLELTKTNDIKYIENSKQNINPINSCSKFTQTEFCALYEYENKEDLEDIEDIEEEEKIDKLNKRKRKNCTDLIRSKLFNYFNKMLYNWIISSKDKIDKSLFQQYYLKQNKKDNIKEVMEKKLKDIFIPNNSTEQITDELIIKKLDSNYKTLFDYFISDGNISNENREFFKNFTFLNNYLETLKRDENEEYINRVRKVAKEYNLWLDKKVHLFKRNTISI